MEFFENIKNDLADMVSIHVKIPKKEIFNLLEKAPENIGSDIALPCFTMAKIKKKSPVEIAKEISNRVKPKGFVKEIKATGPYVNFYMDWNKTANFLLKDILEKKEKYGSSKTKPEKILMDVFQPNPFKSFHIGHVRNAVLGESIRRMLAFTGKKPITVSYTGDVGTHVAKWLWYFQKFYNGNIPKKDFSKWAGDIYAKACEKSKEKREYEKEVEEINRLLDKRNEKIIPLWKKIRKFCYDDFDKIKKELDIDVQYHYPESACEQEGKEIVKELVKKRKLKISEGATIADLKKYNLNVLVVLKSDGTALYACKDIGLLKHKQKYKPDKYVYVVASEQDLYLKQLFKMFEIIGLSKKEHYHISYGLVTLKEGKMASRLGNVIVYEDLKNETLKKARNEINKRNPGIKYIEKTIEQIALGAIKFSMLDTDNNKMIKFDWGHALDFQGRSSPYIQYAHVRCSSILKKAGRIDFKHPLNFTENEEISIIKHLMDFPELIQNAARLYKPNLITNYVFELAAKFSNFYENLTVLKTEETVKMSRLVLVKAVKIVLENALGLLGIEAPEKM